MLPLLQSVAMGENKVMVKYIVVNICTVIFVGVFF